MRFYEISLTDNSGNLLTIGSQKMHFTSFQQGTIGGYTIPGALNVELDMTLVDASVAQPGSWVRIWGLSLDVINQAQNIANTNFNAHISISAGMQRGLPLATQQTVATPPRNLVIFKGSVMQAFGNWQGNEQTLDLMIFPGIGTFKDSDIVSFGFTCKAGTSLATAIRNALNNTGVSISSINIDSRLVPATDQNFFCDNLTTFSQVIYDLSKSIIKDANYGGVKILRDEYGFTVSDNSIPKTVKSAINFLDLIGQPTWLDIQTIQFKTMMRSDINMLDTITLPKANILNTPKSFSQLRDSTSFTGTAQVRQVRHIGNFRQPDANSWASIYDVILS